MNKTLFSESSKLLVDQIKRLPDRLREQLIRKSILEMEEEIYEKIYARFSEELPSAVIELLDNEWQEEYNKLDNVWEGGDNILRYTPYIKELAKDVVETITEKYSNPQCNQWY